MNMFERVAKGMGGVAKGVGDVVFGEGRAAFTVPDEEDDAEVESLLQRIADAISPEYRREAMSQLKDLLADNFKSLLAIGTMGIPVLMNVLRDDKDDLELLHGALESLTTATSSPSIADSTGRNQADVSSLNADILIRTPGAVSLVLSVLEPPPMGVDDFYAQYHVLKLLNALAQASGPTLAGAVLLCPMGVGRLQDMLGQREVLRNEALLLLASLSKASADIAGILAFGGAFEVLLGVVGEEGGAEGGVVVADCLDLIINLLAGNLANQRLFRETGHLPAITQLIATACPPPPETPGVEITPAIGGPSPMSPQKASNLRSALHILEILLAPPSAAAADTRKAEAANRLANQVKLMACGLLEALLPLSLGPGSARSATEVRAAALKVIGDLVAEYAAGQERLGATLVSGSWGEVPVVHAALRCVLSAQSAQESAAAHHLLRGFLAGNADAQTALACTIATTTDDPRQQTFGSELVSALLSGSNSRASSVTAVSRAAAIMADLLAKNPTAQARTLSLPCEVAGVVGPQSQNLLTRVIRSVGEVLSSSHSGQTAAASLLRLVAVWCDGCPSAVAVIREQPMCLAALVEWVKGGASAGPLISGMAAVVLAECLCCSSLATSGPEQQNHVAAPAVRAPNPALTVFDVLVHRVGLATFFMRLEDLKRSPEFTAAAGPPSASQPPQRGSADHDAQEGEGEGGSEHVLDYAFVHFVLEVEEAAKKAASQMFSHPTPPSSHGGAVLPSLSGASSVQEAASLATEIVGRLESEIADLRARNTALAQDIFRVASGGNSAGGSAPGAGSGADIEARVAAEMRASRAEMEAEASKQQVEVLQSQIARLESELRAVHTRVDSAEAAARRAEAELGDLSGAYNALEKHAFQLEEQLRGAKEASTGISHADLEAAVEAAREKALAESEEQMTDLLVCLGQEEAKVQAMGDKLRELNVDVDELLAQIVEAPEEGE